MLTRSLADTISCGRILDCPAEGLGENAARSASEQLCHQNRLLRSHNSFRCKTCFTTMIKLRSQLQQQQQKKCVERKKHFPRNSPVTTTYAKWNGLFLIVPWLLLQTRFSFCESPRGRISAGACFNAIVPDYVS